MLFYSESHSLILHLLEECLNAKNEQKPQVHKMNEKITNLAKTHVYLNNLVRHISHQNVEKKNIIIRKHRKKNKNKSSVDSEGDNKNDYSNLEIDNDQIVIFSNQLSNMEEFEIRMVKFETQFEDSIKILDCRINKIENNIHVMSKSSSKLSNLFVYNFQTLEKYYFKFSKSREEFNTISNYQMNHTHTFTGINKDQTTKQNKKQENKKQQNNKTKR